MPLAEKVVEHLDTIKSDPVRGQFHHAAKELLNELQSGS